MEAPVEEKKDVLPIMLGENSEDVTKVNTATTVTTTGPEVTYPLGVITKTTVSTADKQEYTCVKQGMTYVGNSLPKEAESSISIDGLTGTARVSSGYCLQICGGS